MINQIKNFLNEPANADYRSVLKGSLGIASNVVNMTFAFQNAVLCNEGVKINGTEVTSSYSTKSFIYCSVKNSPYTVPMNFAVGLTIFTTLGLIGCVGLKAMNMCFRTSAEEPNAVAVEPQIGIAAFNKED